MQHYAVSLLYFTLQNDIIISGEEQTMIEVTRLNGTTYWLNPHLIETIESKPDVTIKLLSGNTLIVKETPEEIIEKIINYRKRIGVFKSEL